MTIEEYIARGLAAQAKNSENWPQYVAQANEAIAAMRQATPEILASIRRGLNED